MDNALINLGGIFDLDDKKERLKELDLELADPSIWEMPARAKQLGKDRVNLHSTIESIDKLYNGIADTLDLLEIASQEDDEEAVQLLKADIDQLEYLLAGLEFRRMFNRDNDENNAFLDIQAGSGGTEAQDWAEMLLRMYLRWGESRNFKTELIELSSGDVAGIKSATVQFEGDYAFGWLRTETGVHRLVRKSPFDSGSRRHTSFASVFVSPEIDEDFELEINPADLRVDTYRASGAGGQHVNKTDSAVRLVRVSAPSIKIAITR